MGDAKVETDAVAAEEAVAVGVGEAGVVGSVVRAMAESRAEAGGGGGTTSLSSSAAAAVGLGAEGPDLMG